LVLFRQKLIQEFVILDVPEATEVIQARAATLARRGGSSRRIRTLDSPEFAPERQELLLGPLELGIPFRGECPHCPKLHLFGGNRRAKPCCYFDQAPPLRVDLSNAALLEALPSGDFRRRKVVLHLQELALKEEPALGCLGNRENLGELHQLLDIRIGKGR